MENKIEIFSKQKIKLSRNRIIKNILKKNSLFDEINKRLLERLSIIKRDFTFIRGFNEFRVVEERHE